MLDQAGHHQLKPLNFSNQSAFKKFHKRSTVQKSVLLAIASQINPDEIKDLRETFQSLDTNGDGTVNISDLEKILGNNEQEALTQFIQNDDEVQTGKINYTEFIAASMDRQIFMRDEYIQSAFKMFKTDNKPKIRKSEWIKRLSIEDNDISK